MTEGRRGAGDEGEKKEVRPKRKQKGERRSWGWRVSSREGRKWNGRKAEATSSNSEVRRGDVVRWPTAGSEASWPRGEAAWVRREVVKRREGAEQEALQVEKKKKNNTVVTEQDEGGRGREWRREKEKARSKPAAGAERSRSSMAYEVDEAVRGEAAERKGRGRDSEEQGQSASKLEVEASEGEEYNTAGAGASVAEEKGGNARESEGRRAVAQGGEA